MSTTRARQIARLIMVSINLALLLFCARVNLYRGVPLDEARFVPAGLSHWRLGEFAAANDFPPLARMIAALPLLPLDVKLGDYGPSGGQAGDHEAGLRGRELAHAGHFASDFNPRWFMQYSLARTTGFLWWLLGGWMIVRWSGELNGEMAGWLGLTLWCLSPNVLAYEYQATPDLPFAVVCAAAVYTLRVYLHGPSWERAMLTGLVLGIAQLVEFASLSLFAILPLIALVHSMLRRGGGAPETTLRTGLSHTGLALAACLWVVNLGYGFQGSGSPLGSFDFTNRALKGNSPQPGEHPANRFAGNRFRASWVGRVRIPLPADYLRGLDRRLHEDETGRRRGGEAKWPVEASGRSLATVAGRPPIGIWAMMLGGLVLKRRGRAGSADPADEVIVWIPILTIFAMTAVGFVLFSPAVGILATIPFGIVVASGLARSMRRDAGIGRWFAGALVLCALSDGASTIYAYQLTPEHVARFQRDLEHLGRKLGLPEAEWATTGRTKSGERGLLYRTFVDSRGVKSTYAIFLPRGYRGDHPYPLILFLHGYGDRGTTGRQFTAVGLPFILEYRPVDFLVLCPQGHSGIWDPDGDDARRAVELLAAVREEYRVDPQRIYLTGVSSGGSGVWEFAARWPERWAAIVPIASARSELGRAADIKQIPCWCFHNRYDGGSPAENARKMIDALRAAGGRPRYTEFFDVNHNAWDRAYNMPELYDWLSRQRLHADPTCGAPIGAAAYGE